MFNLFAVKVVAYPLQPNRNDIPSTRAFTTMLTHPQTPTQHTTFDIHSYNTHRTHYTHITTQNTIKRHQNPRTYPQQPHRNAPTTSNVTTTPPHAIHCWAQAPNSHDQTESEFNAASWHDVYCCKLTLNYLPLIDSCWSIDSCCIYLLSLVLCVHFIALYDWNYIENWNPKLHGGPREFVWLVWAQIKST